MIDHDKIGFLRDGWDERIEINGTKGSLKFDFERMNELEYYDARRPRAVT